MARKRIRLVPKDGIEIFEVRAALYFDHDGQRRVNAIVSDPSNDELEVIDLIELRGTIDHARDTLLRAYEGDD